MTKKKTIAVLRGREGLWQLEAWCGQCHAGATCGPPVAVRTEALALKAMQDEPLCTSTYMGKPKNRCNWPMSFGWVFVPILEGN
jgi:hypothetical protein